MTDAIFGPSISDDDVAAAMQAHLTAWLPTELARFAREYGYAKGMPMVSFTQRTTFQTYPAELCPLVIIASGGTVDDTIRLDGDGNYSGAFLVEVAALASSFDEDKTRRLTEAYWKAVREAVIQHGSLSDFAEQTRFVGQDPAGVKTEKGAELTLGTRSGRFHVYVRNFANRFAGPSEPLVDPTAIPDDFPEAETTDLELELETP